MAPVTLAIYKRKKDQQLPWRKVTRREKIIACAGAAAMLISLAKPLIDMKLEQYVLAAQGDVMDRVEADARHGSNTAHLTKKEIWLLNINTSDRAMQERIAAKTAFILGQFMNNVALGTASLSGDSPEKIGGGVGCGTAGSGSLTGGCHACINEDTMEDVRKIGRDARRKRRMQRQQTSPFKRYLAYAA